MEKTEIEQQKVWKYITSLTPTQRFNALFDHSKMNIEEAFDVKIEKWPYTALPDIKDNYAAIAVTDSFTKTSHLAVLIPNS
jgi:hypothetical protein